MGATTAASSELTVNEKLRLIGDLWDDLSKSPELIPVQPWHIEELERRENAAKLAPQKLIPWEELKLKVRNNHV